jgi:hypothetical protein
MVCDEETQWILEQAAFRGFKISRRQLSEWHRRGLVPRPRQVGLGRRKGSHSLYPAGTLNQVLACAHLMLQMSRTEDVGWALWVLGYIVDEQYWRKPLSEAHQRFQETRSISAEPNEPGDDSPPILSDRIESLVDEISNLPTVPQRLSIARRRLRHENLRQLFGVVISTLIGSFQHQENDPDEAAITENILGRLLGVDAATNKAKIQITTALPITGEALVEQLQLMSPFISEIGSPEFLNQFSEADIGAARNELSFLFKLYVAARKAEAQAHAEKAPDVELVVQLFRELKPWQHAIAILIWLAVRRVPEWSENLQMLIKGLSTDAPT